jgi:hypothetical protein
MRHFLQRYTDNGQVIRNTDAPAALYGVGRKDQGPAPVCFAAIPMRMPSPSCYIGAFISDQ